MHNKTNNKYSNCYRCAENIQRKKPITPAQAYWNNFDPGDVPDCIEKLTAIEVKLLCRLIVFMKIHKLKGRFGQYGIQGQAIVFAADASEIKDQIINKLPRSIKDINEVIIVETKEGMKHHPQYVVDVDNLNAALDWLILNNPLYSDLEEILDRPVSDFDIDQIVQELKPELPDQFYKWKTMTAKHDQIPFLALIGKNHQLERHRFPHHPESAGKHGLAICIVGMVYTELKRMKFWTKDDLNNMLTCGNKIYLTSTKIQHEEFDENDEIKQKFNLFNSSMEISIKKICPLPSIAQVNVEKVLPVKQIDDDIAKYFTDNDTPALLRCNNIPIGILKEENDYYVYDPNPRSKFGNPAPKGGNQILMCTKNYDKFLDMVKRSLKINSVAATKTGKYEMMSIAVKLTETKSPACKRLLGDGVNVARDSHVQKKQKTRDATVKFDPFEMEIVQELNLYDCTDNTINGVASRVLSNVKRLCTRFTGSNQDLIFAMNDELVGLQSHEFRQFEIYCKSSIIPVIKQQNKTIDNPGQNEATQHCKNLMFRNFDITGITSDGNSFYRSVSMTILGTDKYHKAMRCIVLKAIMTEETDQQGRLFSRLCEKGLVDHPFPTEFNSCTRTLLSLIKNVVEDNVPATNSCLYGMCIGLNKILLIQKWDQTLHLFTFASVNFSSFPITLLQTQDTTQFLPIMAYLKQDDPRMTEDDLRNLVITDIHNALIVATLYSIDNLESLLMQQNIGDNNVISFEPDENDIVIDLNPEDIVNTNLVCANSIEMSKECCINVSPLKTRVIAEDKSKIDLWKCKLASENSSYNPYSTNDSLDCTKCDLNEKVAHQYSMLSYQFDILRSTHFKNYLGDTNSLKMILFRCEELQQAFCVQRCLAAIAVDNVLTKIHDWNSHILDYICLLGSKIPIESIEMISSYDDDEQMMAENITITTKCLAQQPTTLKLKLIYSSKVHNLKYGITLLFKTHRYGILTIGNLSFTLLRDNDGTYYLYEANIFEIPTESLIVLRTPYLDSFVETISFKAFNYLTTDTIEVTKQELDSFYEFFFKHMRFNVWCVQVNCEDLHPFKEVNLEEEIHCVSSMLMPINVQPQNIGEYLDIGDKIKGFEEELPIVQLKRKTKRKPVNTKLEKRVEELCFYDKFPFGRNGLNEDRPIPTTPLDYFQHRTMGDDPRFWEIRYLFYALSETEKYRASQAVGVCAKLTRGIYVFLKKKFEH